MAMMIRNENELATLRCSIQLSGRDPVLVTQAFQGANSVGSPVFTALEALGLSGAAQSQAALLERFKTHGAEILGQLEALHYDAPDGAAIWLQLSQDSHLAAFLPWEHLIREAFGRTMLRIPNFLRTPYQVKYIARLAICTSGASADQISVVDMVARQLAAFEAALDQTNINVDVTIFAARKDRKILLDKFDHGWKNVNLTIANNANEVAPPKPERQVITNPWLRWISAVYRDTGVDGIHFIAPGHLSGGESALVLPEPPHEDDPDQSQFVGLSELATFYDRLGCSNMCFTPVGADASKNGLRALAYQMSWTRPGSLIVDETTEDVTSLASILQAAWTHKGLAQPIVASTPTYLHPSLANLQENEEDVVAPHPGQEGELAFAQQSDTATAKNDENVAARNSLSDLLNDLEKSTSGQNESPSGLGGLLGRISGNSQTPGDLGRLANRIGHRSAERISLRSAAPVLKVIGHLAKSAIKRFVGLRPQRSVVKLSVAPPEVTPSTSTNAMIQLERAKFSTVKSRTDLEQARDKGALEALNFLDQVLAK